MRKMDYSVCHERGTKRKSESPTGIEPMTSRTPGDKDFLPSRSPISSTCAVQFKAILQVISFSL